MHLSEDIRAMLPLEVLILDKNLLTSLPQSIVQLKLLETLSVT